MKRSKHAVVAQASAAARCLAVSGIVELVVDAAAQAGSNYAGSKSLTSIRTVNRLWKQTADSRIVHTAYHSGKGKYHSSTFGGFDVVALMQRSPGLARKVKTVDLEMCPPSVSLMLLTTFLNVEELIVENCKKLLCAANALAGTPAFGQSIRCIQFAITSATDHELLRISSSCLRWTICIASGSRHNSGNVKRKFRRLQDARRS